MAESEPDRNAEVELLVLRLMNETGIQKELARELVELIGTDWNSLLREARFLERRN
jgi:hypothetical protein